MKPEYRHHFMYVRPYTNITKYAESSIRLHTHYITYITHILHYKHLHYIVNG